MRKLGWIGSLGAGALLAYTFDRILGRRRRAVMRDKMVRLRNKTADVIDVTSRDLINRASGLAAQTRSLFEHRELNDDVLLQRVRSRIAGIVSHPSSIEVSVKDGKVTLSGPILASEVDAMVQRVLGIRGVTDVENHLEVHGTPDSVPALQGEPAQRKSGEVFDFAQHNWSPSSRFIAGTFGAGLALYGARKLNIWGTALAGFGAVILARAATNLGFKRLTGIGAGHGAVTVQKTINVHAPVETVFDFWSRYENFPRFLSNVREVRHLGGNRSHWIVAGPAGTTIEWEAEVTNYVPNKSIGWKTVEGSAVQHAGIVRFESNREGGTRVDIRMSYNPVAGALGHAVAVLFGADAKSEMDQDLNRMKTMIETGTPAHDAAQKDQPLYTH